MTVAEHARPAPSRDTRDTEPSAARSRFRRRRPSADQQAVSPRLIYLIVTITIAGVGGLALGALVSSDAPLVLVIGAMVAPPVIVASLLRPTFGLLVMVLMVYSRFSDVAIEFHGAPSMLQPFLMLLLLGYAFRCAWRREWPTDLTVPLVVCGAYGLVLSLSLFFAPDHALARLAVETYVKDVLIALLVFVLLRTGQTFERVVWTLLATGLLLGTLGTLQYLTGSFTQEFGGFAQADVKNIADGLDDYRISGPLADPNHYAQVLLVLLPLALGRMRGSRRLPTRLLAGVAVLVLTLSLVFTFSRGALVVLALVAAIAVLQRPPPLAALLALAVGAAAVLPFLPSGYTDRLAQLAQAVPSAAQGRTGEASLSGRLSALQAGVDMALDNPVVGVGVSHFPLAYREYSLGLGVDTPVGGIEPHNLYVQVAAETGYLGVLAFGAVLATVYVRLRRGRLRLLAAGERRYADMVQDLQLSMTAYLLASLFVHNAYPRFFWLLVGACLAVPHVVDDVVARSSARGTPTVPARELQVSA